MSKKRPIWITIICWFMMVTGSISIITTTVMLQNPVMQQVMAKSPLPVPLQLGMAYLGLTISVATGFFMLKGKRWARTTYISWALMSFTINLATSPMKWAMFPGLVIFAIIAVLLFLPRSNEFFSSRPAVTDETGV